VEPPKYFTTMDPFIAIYCYMVLTSNLQSYVEAKGNPHWEEAMKEEYNSMIENDTWELVPLPSNGKLVRCNCIFKTKRDADGYITKYKS
jgi:hypothetical protein